MYERMYVSFYLFKYQLCDKCLLDKVNKHNVDFICQMNYNPTLQEL